MAKSKSNAQLASGSGGGCCGWLCGLFKLCGGCTVVLVAIVAVLTGLFHNGFLQGLSPAMGRWADVHGNLQMAGLSPVIQGSRPWGYDYSMLPELNGRVALVTGANSGVGFWTALHLARQGAHVFVGCRSKSKCNDAILRIKANTSTAKVEPAIMDVSCLTSVRTFGEEFLGKTKRLDILVLNAGIIQSAAKRSNDDIEPIFATNHVGHQLLYTLFEPRLIESGEASGDARVVVVSSIAHYDSGEVLLTRADLNGRYDKSQLDPFNRDLDKAYGHSKLANVLFAQEAAHRMARKPVFVNSLHPGAVSTEIWGNAEAAAAAKGNTRNSTFTASIIYGVMDYFKESMWTPEDGALTQVFLAAASEVKERELRGRYFHPQAHEVLPSFLHAHDVKKQRAMWKFTEELIAGRG